MTTPYQLKHGLAAHKNIEEARLNSRMFLYHYHGLLLALKLCHFDILSNIEWLQQLNRRHGPAIFFTQQTIDALFYIFINLLNTNYC